MNRDLRNISLKILYVHFFLILLLLLEYFGYSYTADEIEEIIKLIIPMSTLYTTAALKFVTEKASETDSVSFINEDLIVFAKRVIYVHYLLVFLVIIAGGFNWLPLSMITNGLMLIESLFGIFSGLLTNQLFKIKSE